MKKLEHHTINFNCLIKNIIMKNCLRLKFFSISFFAPILWLGGLTIVLQKMESLYNIPKTSTFLLGFTILILSIVFVTYLLKIIFFWPEVKKEFFHPVKINFFPAFPKWLLILSIVFLSISVPIAKICWIVGVIMNLIFTLWIFNVYINKKFEIEYINPARFIPVVTNIVVPITWLVVFPDFPHISWFFFSIWLVFRLLIFFIFMYRIIFHHPLSQKLLPTLVILIAPPSIGFISLMKLTGGELSPFAYILFYLSCFLFLLLLIDIKKFLKIKFYLSRWAYSFPLAAFALANMQMYHTTKILFFKYSTTAIAVILTSVVLLLIVKTIMAIKQKSLCIEED